MFKNSSIAMNLIITVITTSAVIFGIVIGYNYTSSRKALFKQVEEKAGDVNELTVNKIDVLLERVEKVPNVIAQYFEEIKTEYSIDDLVKTVELIVENNPEIYGSIISFEPFSIEKGQEQLSIYAHRDSDNKVHHSILKGEEYSYLYADWYQIPKELDQALWSEPYFDEGLGNIVMSRYSVPFYTSVDGKRTFLGIITADISLEWLANIVSSIKIAETGYGFLLSKNGVLVTYPEKEYIMNESIFSIAEATGDNALRAIGREMVRGKSGFVVHKSPVTGKEGWLSYTSLPANGWSLATFSPRDEIVGDIVKLSRHMAIIGVAGFAVLIILIVMISRAITNPIRRLVSKTEEMAQGNLDIKLERLESHNELATLSNSFVTMRDSLKRYIRELTETVAAKERIESELHVAHEIQMSMIPKLFPAFPEREEFDVYATLKSAKEVGGDLYNFFMMDENNLCFAIGDVSGKGVPASLFMAVSNTLIGTMAREVGNDPGKILEKVNTQISIGNDACMFVTVFLAIFNITTGEVRYSNAGHNPPIIIPSDSEAYYLGLTAGTSLGIMPDMTYETKMLTLKKGDGIYLYTDGVTEAFNSQGEQYSERRLLDMLESNRSSSVEALIDYISRDVTEFVGDEPQSDDITMIALRYR